MNLDDEIRRMLSDLPVWRPPQDFARRVAASAVPGIPSGYVRRDSFYWTRTALQGAALGILAYVGSALVSRVATSVVLSAATVMEGYARALWLRPG